LTWWNTDWQYRRAITIDNTGNSNTLTDYQVKITLTTSNFDYSKANADGSDIRFIDSDDTTELNYWIQEWNTSGDSIIWVKVPSISADSTKTIYMYYGNTSATAVSDIQNTFVLGREWDNPPYTPPGSGTEGEAEGFVTRIYYPHPTLVANDLPTRGIDHDTANAHDSNSLYLIARKDGRNCEVEADKTLTAADVQAAGKLGYKIRVVTNGTNSGWSGQLGGGVLQLSDGIGIAAGRWLYNDSASIDVSEQDELDFTVYSLDGAGVRIRARTWDQCTSGSYAQVWCDWIYLRKMEPWRDDFSDGNLNGWDTEPNTSITTGGKVGTYCVQTDGSLSRPTNGTSGERGLAYSTWVKFANTTTDKAYYVLLQEDSSSLGNNYIGVWLEYDSDAGGMTFKLKINNSGSLSTYNIYTIPSGEESKWYKVVISIDKFNNKARGYVINENEDTRLGYSGWLSCSSNLIYRVKVGVEGSTTAYFDGITWKYNGDPSISVGSEETPSQSYTQTCTETISLSDTVSKEAGKSLSETLNLADAFSKVISKLVQENISLDDGDIKQIVKTLAEGITLSDSYTKSWTLNREFTENINLSDAVKKTLVKSLLEEVSLTDVLEKIRTIYRTYTESLTLSDSLNKSPAKSLSENISLDDNLKREVVKQLIESLNLNDSKQFSLSKTFEDGIILDDGDVKNIAKTLSESISLNDVYSRIWNIARTYEETLSMEDNATKQGARILADSIVLSDLLFKAVAKELEENINLNDTITKATAIVIAENLGLSDSIVKSLVREFVESLSLADSVTTEKLLRKIYEARLFTPKILKAILEEAKLKGLITE